MEDKVTRVRKSTFGGYYSEFSKWSSKGKSSKEKDRMIEDLKNCVKHQLTRIKRLKYVLQLSKDEKKNLVDKSKLSEHRQETSKKQINLQNKIKTREHNIETLEQNISGLEKSLKQKDREINRLNNSIDKLKSELSSVKKAKKPPIVKEKVVKIIEKLAISDLRSTTSFDTAVRMSLFCNENSLTPTMLYILLHIHLKDYIRFSDLLMGSRNTLQLLEDAGLISFSKANQIKIYHLTLEGKEKVKA